MAWNRVSRYWELRRLMMGVREIDRFLEQWEMNVRDVHRRTRRNGRSLLRSTRPLWRSRADERQGILCRRGPLPCRRRVAGQVGAERRAGVGGLDQPQLRGEGQLLLGCVPGDGRGGVDGCFGRLSRRATATAKRRQPSWNSCGRGTRGD